MHQKEMQSGNELRMGVKVDPLGV
ncbi:uncharacterized protein METZ01_LOCUS136506 [marine metagenome]|uniref:Uncharacterized protein n=1 Tax=marine metagenome TaxID=408172 RepID=A0A381Z449_9ZZZZ